MKNNTYARKIQFIPLFLAAGLLLGCGSSHDEHYEYVEEECCAIYERAIGVLLTDAFYGGPIVNAPILVSDVNGYVPETVMQTDGSGYATLVFESDGYQNPAWVVTIDLPGYHPYQSDVLQTSPNNPSIVIDLALEPY
jgi:hypothetical protein